MRRMTLLVLAAASCGGEARPVADGSVDEWSELDPLPVARANHCSAAVAGHLLVIGGNFRDDGRPDGAAEFVTLDAVHGAALQGDGSLGPWTQVGTLPSPAIACTATSWGNRLLVIDGIYDNDAHARRVWMAEVGADGVLGGFTDAGILPPSRRTLSAEAWVKGETLYVMGGSLPDDRDAIFTLRASLRGDALSWVEDMWLPGWRGETQHAFDGERVFTLGGYLGASQGNAVDVASFRGALAEDGSVSAAAEERPIPAPIAFGEALAVDDHVFLVGGKPAIFGAEGQATVFSARIEDGALADWVEQTPLPAGRTNHDLVLAGDHLYLTGGGFDGPGLATVYAGRVRR